MSNMGAEDSPTIFDPPKKGPGGKKLNGWPTVIGSVIGAVFLLVIFYTVDSKQHADAMAQDAAMENRKATGASVAPIKRPEGPDVHPIQIAQVTTPYIAPDSPMPIGLSEAERKAQEKKIADYEAAINASPRVANSGIRQRQRGRQEQDMSMMPPPGSVGLMPAPPVPGDTDEGDVNHQARKREFLKANDSTSGYLKNTRTPPLFPLELQKGTIIPIVMISGINSDLPGQCLGQVRQNVYDSATHTRVLIPAGAKAVCSYDSDVSPGQARVLLAWTDIKYPDGSSLSLGAMPGTDKSGVAGLHDKVDNHYLRTFGQAALLSLFTAASQLSQTRGSVSGNYSASQILAAQVGMQGFNLGSQLIRRNLNIQPTLEIRPGMEATIAVTKDIGLPEWRGHPMARNVARVEE